MATISSNCIMLGWRLHVFKMAAETRLALLQVIVRFERYKLLTEQISTMPLEIAVCGLVK